MLFRSQLLALSGCIAAGAATPTYPFPRPQPSASPVVNSTTCVGKSYVYEELAGVGIFPGNLTDKFGDTLGGIGSSVAIDQSSYRKKGNSYTGIIWTLPDRGWNTEGTLNFNPRVHKFNFTLTPVANATVQNPAHPNLQLTYLDTVRFSGPDGTPMTGLDPDIQGAINFPGFPDLPVATYTGDGFGRNGTGGQRIPLDSEGIVLTSDGGFWISDEYAPYVYRFDSSGKMVTAIRPPDAFIPIRNGSQSFNAASPPRYDPDRETIPTNPSTGRQNNQGLEGLSASPDGKILYTLIQSALIQEGGLQNRARRNARLLQYDVSSSTPKLTAEYVVPLPFFLSGNTTRVAAQSEIHFLSNTSFLILSRDSNAGRGDLDSTQSLYRQIDVFDLSNATNILGRYDAINGSIASAAGVLRSGITPATYCPFIDINDNAQLNRFGLHNGGENDANLLNEKWESLAIVPTFEAKDEYFLFTLSDNDFITQNGFMAGGTLPYADESGFSLDNQALVFRVKLPLRGGWGGRWGGWGY